MSTLAVLRPAPQKRLGGRKCSVCARADRPAVEDALLSGLSIRHASSRFGLGRMAVQRHAARCIPSLLALADAARGQARQREAVALAHSLAAYEGSLVLVAQEAWATGQFGPAVNALARAAQLRILRESRSVSAGGGTAEDATNVLVIPAGHDIDLEALASIPSAKVVLRSGNASIGAGFPPATPSD